VDLLEPVGSQVHAVEIKAGATINSDYFKGLAQFKKSFPEKFLAGSVIYAGEQAQQRTQWQVLPWSAAETGALSSINRSQKT